MLPPEGFRVFRHGTAFCLECSRSSAERGMTHESPSFVLAPAPNGSFPNLGDPTMDPNIL